MKRLLIITALALLLPAAGLCWTTSDAMRAVVAAKNAGGEQTPGSSPTFNDVDTGSTDSSGGTSFTMTSTIDSQLSNGYAETCFATYAEASDLSLSYDSTEMTQIGDTVIYSSDNLFKIRCFGVALGNKAAGTYDVVFTVSPGTYIYGSTMTFNGVDQSSPTGTAVANQGTSTSPTVTLSGDSTDLMVTYFMPYGDPGTVTDVGTGQTRILTGDYGYMSTEAGDTSVTTSWSTSSSTGWLLMGVPLHGI